MIDFTQKGQCPAYHNTEVSNVYPGAAAFVLSFEQEASLDSLDKEWLILLS